MKLVTANRRRALSSSLAGQATRAAQREPAIRFLHSTKSGSRPLSSKRPIAILRSVKAGGRSQFQCLKRWCARLRSTQPAASFDPSNYSPHCFLKPERANKALADKRLDAALEYKIQWDRELERRASLGISAPEPIPHPERHHHRHERRAGEGSGSTGRKRTKSSGTACGLLEESDREIGELTEDIKLCKTKRQRQPIEDEFANRRRALRHAR